MIPPKPWPRDARPYADLRRRFSSALTSVLPAVAHYPLTVLLEEFDEYVEGGPARDPREVDALQGILSALLAYRNAYRERAQDPSPVQESAGRPRWALFCMGWHAMPGERGLLPHAPPDGVPERRWGLWARLWVQAGSPTGAAYDEWMADVTRSGALEPR